jgi:glycosyltransferase involved in cell wall biosynthesis
MRVFLDCRMASWTGVGRYTRGLARALAARDDIELTQISASGERPPVAAHQGAAHLVTHKHPFSLGGARELGRVLAAHGPDIVHCPHFPTPMPVAYPLVVTFHDLTPLAVPGVMRSPLRRLAYRWWLSRAASKADALLTLSTFSARDAERYFKAAEGKTRVTFAAADDFTDGPMGQLTPALAEIADWPYLLSMGSTRKHKDLATLMRAFARIAPSYPELRLLLVGECDRAFVAASLPAASAEIRERVIFTGRVEDPQLRTLYAGAQLFAFPSVYEGFGLPPLEAMAFETPCIVADATSLPEVVADAALLFPPGNSDALASGIEQLLNDPVICDDLRQAGLRRVGELSWEHTAERTVAAYAEVLSRK